MALEKCPKCNGKGIVMGDKNAWLDGAITELIKMGHIKVAAKMMDVKENI